MPLHQPIKSIATTVTLFACLLLAHPIRPSSVCLSFRYDYDYYWYTFAPRGTWTGYYYYFADPRFNYCSWYGNCQATALYKFRNPSVFRRNDANADATLSMSSACAAVATAVASSVAGYLGM